MAFGAGKGMWEGELRASRRAEAARKITPVEYVPTPRPTVLVLQASVSAGSIWAAEVR